MKRILFVSLFLITALCAFAFAQHHSAFAAQSPGSGRITGKVIERDSGKPVVAEIGISTREKGNFVLKHAKTSETGEFEVGDLKAGDLHLTTKLEGYATEHRSVSLADGETLYVEFYIIKVRTISGVVLNPTSKPVAGAEVRVIYREEAPAPGALVTSYQWESGEVKTDIQGKFELDVHPEKEFVVEASHPDFLGVISAPIRVSEKAQSVSLSLIQGITIVGELKDEDGNIVRDAQVSLSGVGADPTPNGFTSFELLKQSAMNTVSSADGTFRLNNAKPARAVLTITHPKYKPLRQVIDLAKAQGQVAGSIVLKSKD
jgi:hypothetical protein